jgi:hypothetical protein
VRTGPDSICSRAILAAEQFCAEIEARKSGGLVAKLAMDMFAQAMGNRMFFANTYDAIAAECVDQAEEFAAQLQAHEEAPQPVVEDKQAEDESDSEGENKEVEQPQKQASTQEPQKSEADKPKDAPVEALLEKGIPAKIVDVLVGANLTTVAQVRVRDRAENIEALPEIGPAIRKKVLAAINELIGAE